MTEKTKAVPGATRKTVQHGRAKPVVETKKNAAKGGIAFLIEDVMERSELVTAAKGISTELQDMAEKLSTVEAKDIMPLTAQFRETFGPQAADQFTKVATAQIRGLITAVQNAKNGLDNEIDRLRRLVDGEDGSDAAMDAELPPSPLPGAPPPDEAGGDLPPPEAGEGAEGVLPELPPSDAGDVAMGATGFAGRARKEGARIRGRKLTEDNAAEGGEFRGHMDHLAAMSPKCHRFASDIAATIHDLAVSGDVRNKLTNALGHVVSMARSGDVWDDPSAIADMGMAAHLVDGPLAQIAGTPEVAGIIKQLHKLAHMIGFKHSGDLTEDDYAPTPTTRTAAPLAASPLAAGPVMESLRRARNIKRLREARNPDKMILSVFRRVFRECRNVTSAVIGTARAFGIDTSDVVTIIREAKGRVAEDAVPALMGVAMGKPDPNSNPALMSQVPVAKPTAAAPQPGQPNKAMSPADMRASAQTRNAQDQAAGNNPKQPIAQPPAPVPVQQVKPQQGQQQPLPSGQQQVQPVQNNPQQVQQQQQVKKKPLQMPGKIANNGNVAESADNARQNAAARRLLGDFDPKTFVPTKGVEVKMPIKKGNPKTDKVPPKVKEQRHQVDPVTEAGGYSPFSRRRGYDFLDYREREAKKAREEKKATSFLATCGSPNSQESGYRKTSWDGTPPDDAPVIRPKTGA